MPNVSLQLATLLGLVVGPLWFLIAVVTVTRALRREAPAQPGAAGWMVVLAAAAGGLVVLATLLPFPSQATDRMFMWSFTLQLDMEAGDELWGIPNRGLGALLRCVGLDEPSAHLLLLRVWLVLSVPVLTALVLLVRRAHRPARFDVFAALLVALGILNLGMSRGILEGRYLAPLPVVFVVLLLSVLLLERGENRWALASLATSLVLVVLFRPESPMVGLAIAGVLLVRWWRRERAVRITLGAVVATLGFISIAGVTNLLLATERDVIVFGAETAAHPSTGGVVGMLAGRVISGWLPSFLVQGLWTGGLLFLSVPAAVWALRRKADLPTWVALIWLFMELTILSVHDSGPAFQWQKYGLVLIGPAWFLAAGSLLKSRGTAPGDWATGGVVFLVSMTFAVSLSFACVNRDVNRENQDWGLYGAEEVVARVCPSDPDAARPQVSVIMLEGSFSWREETGYFWREVEFLPHLLYTRGCSGPWEHISGPADAALWESGEPCQVFPRLCAEGAPDDVLIVADGCRSWDPHLAALFDEPGEGGWEVRHREDMVILLHRADPRGQ